MVVKILKKTKKPFKNSEGVMMDYWWYKAERNDGVQFDFGSRNGDHEENSTADLTLYKTENSRNRIVYKEAV